MRKTIMNLLILLLFIACLPGTALASEDLASRVQALERLLQAQQKQIEAQQKIIDGLKSDLHARQEMPASTAATPPQPSAPKSAVVAIKDRPKAPSTPDHGSSGLFAGLNRENPNISLVFNTYAYGSNKSDTELRNAGIPGITTSGLDRRKGMNLDAAELFFFAPVDPYFQFFAALPVKEDGATVEEAYITSTALPKGHRLKAGKFRSNITRFNAQHPHAWDFVDAPLPYRGFFGGEGFIEKGVQYTYLPALPFYTLVGAEVLQGENSTLFGRDAAGGPHAYSAFVRTSLDFGAATLLFGPFVVHGKTATDTARANYTLLGDSTLYGFEMTYKWRPTGSHHHAMLQAEYLLRDQRGNLTQSSSPAAIYLTRRQDGFYVQGIFGIDRWRFGARYDMLGAFKDDYILGGVQEGQGHTPWRASLMSDYAISDFFRLRLQYTYDESARVGSANQEVFLQAVVSLGAHEAHPY